MKFTPTAVWRTRTSPLPGGGTVTSCSWRTSAPPTFSKRMAFVIDRSTQIGAEELCRTLVRLVGRLLVKMLAADAREGVIAFGVGVDRHALNTLQAFDDLRLCDRRNELILAGDVEHQRFLDLVLLGEVTVDIDAVV